MTTPPTASQTVGPFFHLGMAHLERGNFVAQGIAGERVTIRGQVLDADGNAVPDAMLEIWQADSSGRYGGEIFPQNSATPRFLGFGRIETDDKGEFEIKDAPAGKWRMVMWQAGGVYLLLDNPDKPDKFGKQIEVKGNATTDLGQFKVEPPK